MCCICMLYQGCSSIRLPSSTAAATPASARADTVYLLAPTSVCPLADGQARGAAGDASLHLPAPPPAAAWPPPRPPPVRIPCLCVRLLCNSSTAGSLAVHQLQARAPDVAPFLVDASRCATCCCRAMYGLLQLLPQSDAFRTLHARLHAAPTAALLQLSPPPDGAGNGAPGKSPAEVRV